jgi:hypothetical protein
MDRACEKHGGDGKGTGGHRFVWEATPLEWVVVQSFSEVEPAVAIHSGSFSGWSQGELYMVCYMTDDVDEVSKNLFNDMRVLTKMKRYISLFHAAASMLDEGVGVCGEGEQLLPVGQRMVDLVSEWSDGVDPLTYIVMMKRRIDDMSGKITRLKNTATIWKEDSISREKEVGELKKKLRFLKYRNDK